MKNKKDKKAIASAVSSSTGYSGVVPKNLGELRTKFDGLRAVANKFESGAYKTQLMNHIEELYLATGTWFKGIGAPPIEA